jgi:uncharacterized protein (TIGR03067 family)
MTRYVLMALVVGLLLAAGPVPKEDEAKKEAEKLQGAWQIVSYESRGVVSDRQKDDVQCVVVKNTVVFKENGKVVIKATFTLDPSKTPTAITLTCTEGEIPEEKGKVEHGIYEVDKDSMKWCVTDEGEKDRPKEFVTKKGSTHAIYTFKKGKP